MFSLHLFLLSVICTFPASTTASSNYILPGSVAAAPDYDSNRCTAATKSAGRGCAQEQTCYKLSDLYNTPPKKLCSCLDQTVNASKKVAKACASKRDGKGPYKFFPNDVYVGWSNRAAAKVACSIRQQGTTCIEEIAQIAPYVQSETLGVKVKDMAKKLKCEEPCFKKFYKACDRKGDLAPALYLYGGTMAQDIFASWEKYCKWEEY